MAFTDRGFQQAMSVGIDSTTRYISLHLNNDNELSGHGYARKSISPSQMTVSNSGVITGPANFQLYIASDDAAQRAQKLAIYDASTGGNQLVEPETISSPIPAAPTNGQALQMTITLSPE